MCFGHSRCRRRHYEHLRRGKHSSERPWWARHPPARADDIDRVLDPLTHHDQPRAAFEPWYEHEPAYRPELSWLAEKNGRLVAHLRIYPRQPRLGAAAR